MKLEEANKQRVDKARRVFNTGPRGNRLLCTKYLNLKKKTWGDLTTKYKTKALGMIRYNAAKLELLLLMMIEVIT